MQKKKRKYVKSGKYSKYVLDEYGDKELTVSARMKILGLNIKKISAEKVNRNKKKWHTSLSLKSAKSRAGRKHIYRTPSGVYVWRK